MYHVWPKASWLWLPSPLFLPRMLTCTLRDSRCVRDPTMVGSTFCRTCEVEGPLYLYSTLLGRGWPCYHVLEGPTDFKGVVLKVWTCGLGGGGPTDKRGHRYTPNLLFHCGFSPFLQTLICLVWFHSPVFRRNYCIFLSYHKYELFPHTWIVSLINLIYDRSKNIK